MNFAALWARNSGRATPSLRCTPKAPTKETRQKATYLQREVVQTTAASSLMHDDICYKKTFLKEVVARIDFLAPLSGVENTVPEKFASTASKYFPLNEPSEAIGYELQLGAEEKRAKETRFKQWNYFGTEREKQLTLTAQSLFASYRKYEKYEDIKAEFSAIVDVLANLNPDARSGRFGLRYVNQIELSLEVLPNPIDWGEYINTNLLGVRNFFDAANTVTRLFHIAEEKCGDLNLLFQFGLPNPDYPAIIRRPLFVLDIDASVPIAHGLKNSIQYMDQAHSQIQRIFEKSITPKLRDVMNG